MKTVAMDCDPMEGEAPAEPQSGSREGAKPRICHIVGRGRLTPPNLDVFPFPAGSGDPALQRRMRRTRRSALQVSNGPTVEGEAPAEPNSEIPTRLARRLALQVSDGPAVEGEAPAEPRRTRRSALRPSAATRSYNPL